MATETKKDMIGRNNYVDGKPLNYNKYLIPTPPRNHFKHTAHFWVAKVDADKRVYDPRVLQWSPVQMQWFESGMTGTYLRPINGLEGALLLGLVVVPDIPHELVL